MPIAPSDFQQALETFGLVTPAEDFWVFGYGSLMWNPGFIYRRKLIAQHYGRHRAFAMRSLRHRGSLECPGLVLALVPGGSCRGFGFQVPGPAAADVCAYLLEREMSLYAYRPAFVPVHLHHGRVQALTFLPVAGAKSYLPGLSLAQQARAIAFAVGGKGSNLAYLRQTVVQMQALGLPTACFEALEATALALREAHE